MFRERCGDIKDWLFEVDGRVGSGENANRSEGAGDSGISGEGIALLSSDGIFTYADEGFVDLIGGESAEALVDRNWRDVFGKTAARLEKEVLPDLKEGETWRSGPGEPRVDGGKFLQGISLTKTASGEIVCKVKELSPEEKIKIVTEKNKEKVRKLRDGLDELQNSPSKYDIYNTALEVLRGAFDIDFCTMRIEEDDLCLMKGNTDGVRDDNYDLYGCVQVLSERTRRRKELISGDGLGRLVGDGEESEANYSYLSVPIGGLGSVQVFYSQENSFTDLDKQLVEITGSHLYERINRARLEGDLKRQAIHDQLTGLYNRHYLDKVLAKETERSRRYGHALSLFMIDINNFKDVNDRYSHSTGDQVLVQIGQIFRENVREPDTVIRYGGDEFLILMPETGSGYEDIKQRLKDKTRSWSRKTDLIDFTLTLAIGTARYEPEGEQPVEQVINTADKEMYEDKQSISNNKSG